MFSDRGDHSGSTVDNPIFEDPEQNRTQKAPQYVDATQNQNTVKKKTCYSIIRKHARQISTAHGYPMIFNSESWYGKLFWTLVVVTAFVFFLRQAIVLVTRYIDAPVAVELKVVSKTFLDFPAVTVCNTNKVRRSAISSSKHRQVLTVDVNTPTAYRVPCIPGDFMCANGTECVKPYLVCDGIRHCADQSDEPNECIYGECGNQQFKCSSGGDMGVCISNDLVCDNIVHCYNGEDEIDCECKNSEYKCDIGICIPKLKVCDGKIDCSLASKNSSDERHSLCDPVELQRTGWKCGLTVAYIPQLFVCDGYEDCPGGEDEDNCVGGDSCKNSEYKCATGICIPKTKVCDGSIDCSLDSNNSSDEQRSLCDPVELERTGWKCGLTNDYIPQLFLCDGYKDCPSGEDEDTETCVDVVTCEGDQLSCETSSLDINGNRLVECIPHIKRCDGVLDCYDMMDESNLYCTVDLIQPMITNMDDLGLVIAEFVDGIEPRGAYAKWEEIIATDNFGDDQLRIEGDIFLHTTGMPGIISTNLTKGDFFPEGEYIVLERVTDEAGNYVERWVNISVRAVPEIITIMGCPDDITKEIGTNVNDVEIFWNPPTAVLSTIGVNGSESLAPNVYVSSIYMPGDRFPPGVTVVNYKFRSEIICSFNIIILVADMEPPEIFGCDISKDFTMTESIFFDGSYKYNWSRPYAVERPNKSHEVFLVTETRRNGDLIFFPGRTTVCYVFGDASGNTAKCNFTVTVPDDVPPTVKCPGDINQSVPAGITGKFLIWEEPTVSDYSSRSGEKVILVSQSHTSGQLFPLGYTGVTYEYSDWAGNIAMCEFGVYLLQNPDQEVEMFDCEDGIQVPMWQTCNTVPDCSNGKDELVCGSFEVICNVNSRPCRGPESVRQCKANTAECDFTQDCTDGTDEMYCDFPDNCGDDYFQCPSSRVCLHRYFRCNGKVDCEDGYDENDCDDPGIEESPFVKDWYLRYNWESFPTNIDYEAMSLKFEEEVYQPRGFHRVKGENPPDWNSFFVLQFNG
ncbi:uncharacterized protein [Amphiura filiformis]|uniref:uncharacterized protein n=1 Tax=Amphiura filiformis TaxID=82378 RepID=UPI003B224EB4